MPPRTPGKPAGLAPHVAGYIRRLDYRIANLDALERHALLVREQAKWIRRYERFAHKAELNEPTDDDEYVTAWDYLDTILHINQLLSENP